MGQSGGGFNGAWRTVPWWLQAFVAIISVLSVGVWALAGVGGALAALGIETEPEEEQISVTAESTTSTTREHIESTTTTDRPTIRTTTSTTAPPTTTTTRPPPTTTTTVDPFANLSAEEQAALESYFNPPPPPPPPPPSGGGCSPNYSGCVPIDSDVDCAGGSGNGPSYTSGPVSVIGSDVYDLDADNDGVGCE